MKTTKVISENEVLSHTYKPVKNLLAKGSTNKVDLPSSFLGFNVIDGDKTDIEMMSNNGVILGLKAKGKAKKDTTGFVVRNLSNN
jgi:hypothetical protein